MLIELCQVKFGDSTRYITDFKNDISIIENMNVVTNFIKYISKILNEFKNTEITINLNLILYTSRNIGNYQNKWDTLKDINLNNELKIETFIIRILKDSNLFPDRIKNWLKNRNDTFFDKKKRNFKINNNKKKKFQKIENKNSEDEDSNDENE